MTSTEGSLRAVGRRRGTYAALALAVAGTVVVAPRVAMLPSASSLERTTAGDGGVVTEREALAAARACGERVEVGAFRREDREIYANPDGTFTAVEHLRPVRTMRDGQWVAIDTTLVRRDDGSVAPVAASVGMAFSGGGTDAPLARMSRANRSLSLT